MSTNNKRKNFKKGLILGIILGFVIPISFVFWLVRESHRTGGGTYCSQTISCEDCDDRKGTQLCKYLKYSSETEEEILRDVTCPCR